MNNSCNGKRISYWLLLTCTWGKTKHVAFLISILVQAGSNSSRSTCNSKVPQMKTFCRMSQPMNIRNTFSLCNFHDNNPRMNIRHPFNTDRTITRSSARSREINTVTPWSRIKGILEAALRTDVKIQPVSLGYTYTDEKVRRESEHFFWSLWPQSMIH